ncbi:MAG: ribonuclease HII [Alphaproteobacteria bacterium]|nr:ribonuclease HII [Alphaproteobacteria bacterium]MBF0394752.1 ribonuclease HII [Alphaproteobacteria bacterium]
MPDFSHEIALGGVVAGLDEAGRGPLAGPVVAAAVVFDHARLPARLLAELNDSKRLSAKKREEMFPLIQDAALCVGVGRAEVDEIDRVNILRATFLAMGRAVAALGVPIDRALVDGNQKPPLPCPTHCLVGGDGLSLSVAAASVIAKVTRDRLMVALAQRFPGYGWERNAGYGTPEHMRALDALGPSPHHRRSFAPVQLAFDIKSS